MSHILARRGDRGQFGDQFMPGLRRVIVNVQTIEPTDEPDWWLMTTPHGPAKLRIRGNAEQGVLVHDYVDDMASWQVPARVVPHGAGSEFMITFFRPASFTDAFFDKQTALVDTGLTALVDTELTALKQVLEADA